METYKMPVRYVIAEIISGHLIIDEKILYKDTIEVERYIRRKMKEDKGSVFTFLPYFKQLYSETI